MGRTLAIPIYKARFVIGMAKVLPIIDLCFVIGMAKVLPIIDVLAMMGRILHFLLLLLLIQIQHP